MSEAQASVQDVTTILSSAQVSRIQESFSPEAMAASGIQRLSGLFPPVQLWLKAIQHTFLEPSGLLSHRDRERTLIGVLAASPGTPALFLAIHYYWGLGCGLSVQEIAST